MINKEIINFYILKIYWECANYEFIICAYQCANYQ